MIIANYNRLKFTGKTRFAMKKDIFDRLVFAVSNIDYSIIQLKRDHKQISALTEDKRKEVMELLTALVTDIKTIEANLNDIISTLS